MGNFLWVIVMLVPSLGFFVYLIYSNVRSARMRKAQGLPPLGLTPPRLRNRGRKNVTYVVVDERQRQESPDSAP